MVKVPDPAGEPRDPLDADLAAAAAADRRRILTVRQLNEQIQAALQNAFAAPVWVRGEVQRLAPDAARRQHVYFELHEAGRSGAAGFQIQAAILGWDRDRHGLGRYLDGSDPAFRLQDKLEVCLQCRVDFYPPFGKVNLRVIGIDPEFSLGQLERKRRQVLAWLEAQGLLALNATRPLADLPLRVGLVTSRGSAAAEDVRASLAASGYPFQVTLADCRMQGEQTAPQIIVALARLAALPLDVVLIARGGGSRADLSWFDQPDLCAAVARCPLPVVTAIGHEIDTSLVDLCAHTRCKTPTAAAAFLIERLQRAEQRLAAAAGRLAGAAPLVLADAWRRLDDCRRLEPLAVQRLGAKRQRIRTLAATLEGRTARAVARRQRQLLVASGRLVHGGRLGLAAARRRTDYLAGQLTRQAPRAAAAQGRRLATAADALAAPARRLLRERAAALDLLGARARGLDPRRLLERGFTLTLDAQGRLLRLAAAVQPGQVLRTRFADGEVTSVAQAGIRPAGRTAVGRQGRQGGKDGDEEGSGQQALF